MSAAFSRYGLSVCVAAAVLIGCGGPQSSIGAPAAMPQGARAYVEPATASKKQPLIYTSRGCGGTCVLAYTNGSVAGSLPTDGTALCSDTHGNVFITSYDEVEEYAHGGTQPIENLTLPSTNPGGCSVDPKTHNLAVVLVDQNNDIAIFPKAKGSATVYASGLKSQYCGYDKAGNLFVSGYNAGQPGLSELPSGSSNFVSLSINGSIGTPGQVQWDGKYMTVEDRTNGNAKILRLTISGSVAGITQTVALKGIKGSAFQSWIYGNYILVPYSAHGSSAKSLGIWNYPKGGAQIRAFDFGTYKQQLHLTGVTVSV